MAKKQSSAPAAETAYDPTVSVSEAMGLPENWDFAASLKGTDTVEDPTKLETHTEPKTPAEPDEIEETEEETPEEKAPEAPAEKEEKVEAKPAPKTAAKPAPAAAKPAPKTAMKPKVEVAPAPAAPATPAKLKVGGKEYTEEELQALITPKPVAAPVPAAPAAPEKKELTAEEKAAQEEKGRQQEAEWVTTNSKLFTVPVDAAKLDAILQGGPEAVKTFQETMSNVAAQAMLMTRKSMYNELAPIIQDLRDRQQPLVDAQVQEQDQKEWTSFAEKYPDLSEAKNIVDAVAQAMIEREPDRVRGMSMEQFKEAVATKATEYIDQFVKPLAHRFVPQAAAAATPEAKPAAAPAGEKAAPAAVPLTKQSPVAAPTRAKVAPPAAAFPSPTGAAKAKEKGGDSEIIQTLW